MIYFTSDLHFNTWEILLQRPQFKTREEMDSFLITQWNQTVNDDDEVFVVGDFALTKYDAVTQILEQLKGIKYMLVGNHDRDAFSQCKYFKWIRYYADIVVDNQRIILNHYPMAMWDGMESRVWHLYGHDHKDRVRERMPRNALSYNVGTQLNNYKPLSFVELKEKIEQSSPQ